MSQIWFGGIGAGGGAFGAGAAYPDFAHSVRAQFCPIPQAIPSSYSDITAITPII